MPFVLPVFSGCAMLSSRIHQSSSDSVLVSHLQRSERLGARPSATPRLGAGGSMIGYADPTTDGAIGASTDAFAKVPVAAANFEQRWSVWASGFGGSQSTSGSTTVGSNNTTSSVYGTAVGADYLFSPATVAGFALAGGGTSFSVVNGGAGHSDLF
jgi:hypothetical protein